MINIETALSIIVNIGIIASAIYAIYTRFIFKKQAEAVREFATFCDTNSSEIKLYELHQKAKRNVLDRIISEGLKYGQN